MKQQAQRLGHAGPGRRTRATRAVSAACGMLIVLQGAGAAEIDTGNPDLKLRWDNTVKYSTAFRLKKQSAELIDTADGPNFDDGDRNFNKGPISSRFDLLSEADLTYKNVGARISGAAWYDSLYNRDTDNGSPFTYNSLSVPYTEFNDATRKLHGRKAELLEAFVFATGAIGEMPATVRMGRHALVYGETLFYGANGIAAAQQPIDVVKAQSVPNTQFKELIRPVGQVSAQIQIKPNLAVGAYYQYRWEANRLPGVGSYFAFADNVGAGVESMFMGPPPTPRSLYAGALNAKDSGQGGMQVKWTPSGSDVDLGFYAVRYHSKSPEIVLGLTPTPAGPFPSTFRYLYHEGILSYGVSASKTFGEFNVSAEASVRRNAPLSHPGSADLFGIVPAAFGGPAAPADNAGNPVYPVGRTAHLNISTLATLSPNFIAAESSLAGELAWNRVTSVLKNANHMDPNADRDAWGMRLVYTPSYRQVRPGLDLDVPIGIGYTPKGRSAALGAAFGADKGGDISIGVNGRYEDVWLISLSFTHYYGAAATVVSNAGGITAYTYKQALKDRDFASLSVRRTF
jgi:hypothetical protein